MRAPLTLFARSLIRSLPRSWERGFCHEINAWSISSSGGNRDLRGRKNVIKDNGVGDDDWGDNQAKDQASKGANFGGTGFGGGAAEEEEEWD